MPRSSAQINTCALSPTAPPQPGNNIPAAPERIWKGMKAIWEDTVIAESNQCVVIEGNQYFPAESVKREYFEPSANTTVCAWKGTASYYDIVVNGKRNAGAAWYYADPKDAAKEIRGRVAFWKGVKVSA